MVTALGAAAAAAADPRPVGAAEGEVDARPTVAASARLHRHGGRHRRVLRSLQRGPGDDLSNRAVLRLQCSMSLHGASPKYLSELFTRKECQQYSILYEKYHASRTIVTPPNTKALISGTL